VDVVVRLADGTAMNARVMGPWRPLAYPRARLEWCVAVAKGTVLLLAVRARGGSRIVGAVSPDASVLSEADARAVVEAHGGPTRLAEDAPLGWNLVGLGFIREDEVAAFLSMQSRVPMINLDEYEIDPEVLALVPVELCTTHLVLPVSRAGSSLIVAMVDPNDDFLRDTLAAATGFAIEPVIAPKNMLRAAIARCYPP
jgi:hypothetical protein